MAHGLKPVFGKTVDEESDVQIDSLVIDTSYLITTYDITVNPWRFDTARNIALGLIPKDIDICVSLDIDEILMPGWREEIERVWTDKTTRLQYRYDWSKNHIFDATKIHKRVGYTWQSMCHEMIFPDPRTPEVWATTDFLLIRHLPDETKSRGNYLHLLQADVQQDPNNARNSYYYARELYFNRQYKESIEEWTRWLKLPGATWYHERCYAFCTMAKCYDLLGDIDSAITMTEKASKEAKNLREPLVLMAELYQKQRNWRGSFAASTRALGITKREYAYTSDDSVWGSRPYDAAAISAYYLDMKKTAKEYGQQALDIDPTNPRLIQNMEWYSK